MFGRTLIVTAGIVLSAAPLRAQTDSSLADRVRRLEALVDLLQQQVGEQATAQVAPRGGSFVELSGIVLVNGFFNNAKVDNSDVPVFVLPPDPPGGLPASHSGATARQTRIALTAFTDGVLGGAFRGEVDLDFYGGQLASSGGRFFPLARLRRVRADLSWKHAYIMVGQEAPPIAEINPSSLAGMGVPTFTGAGNLWLWIPQTRAGLHTASTLRLGIEGALVAPRDGNPVGTFATQPDRGERSRRPFLQGRTFARWGSDGRESQLSVGGHLGWLATTADTLLTSRAVVVAGHIAVTRFFDIRGEFFSGQALGTLGGGGIGQSLGVADDPVNTTGGWGQLNILPAPAWEVGGGFGIDNPRDADLDPATARLENRSFELHLHWRPHPLVLGIEYRRIETTYGAPTGVAVANHVNVAVGFVF